MNLDIISYDDLLDPTSKVRDLLEQALLNRGIVGVSHIPQFENITRQYIQAAQTFSKLDKDIKLKYAPNRDIGDTEGYELGAEWFQTSDGQWQKDDKKASFYAFVPDHPKNKWPQEVDLRSTYLALGQLIFMAGKNLLKTMNIDKTIGLNHETLTGYGRMLHYYPDEQPQQNTWCGAHFDHGIFTGLVPAYYFKNGIEVPEPEEAGLFIIPTGHEEFVKIPARDKSILLFQVGEFGQLLSHDKICATKHIVKKPETPLERYTFALFFNPEKQHRIHSKSLLTKDARYATQQTFDGFITYQQWETASYERYRAK